MIMAHEAGPKMVISRNSGSSKVKNGGKLQGPVPTEAPPSTPAAPIGSPGHYRADVENRFQQFLTTEKIASDLFWDQMGVDAGRYWLIYSLRDLLQPLARKYFNQPSIFYLKFLAAYKRHLRRLVKTRSGRKNIAWYNHFRLRVENDLAALIPTLGQGQAESRPPALPRLPDNISGRQLTAIDSLLPVWGAPYTGLPLTKADPKKVIAALKVLAAHSPGAGRKADYDKAYELKKSGKKADEICKILKLYPPNSNPHERKAIRQEVLSACQYRKKTEPGVRKSRP